MTYSFSFLFSCDVATLAGSAGLTRRFGGLFGLVESRYLAEAGRGEERETDERQEDDERGAKERRGRQHRQRRNFQIEVVRLAGQHAFLPVHGHEVPRLAVQIEAPVDLVSASGFFLVCSHGVLLAADRDNVRPGQAFLNRDGTRIARE